MADLGPDAVVQGRSGLLGVALYVTDHVNGRQLILTSPDGVVWTVDDPTRHGVPENAFVDTPFVGSDHLGFVLRLPSDAHGHSEVITLLGTPTR